jgi:hypothetical protein
MDWLLLTGKLDQSNFVFFYFKQRLSPQTQRIRVAGTLLHILYPTEQTHTHLQTGQNDPTSPYGASETRL